MKRTYQILLLASLVFVSIAAPEGYAQDHSRSVLVSACHRGDDTSRDNSRSVFALVFEVGELTAVLYELQDSSRRPIAWMHYGSPESDEFFEAEGGIQSTAVAREIFLYLTSQPFILIDEWADDRTVRDLDIVTECTDDSKDEKLRTK